MELVQLGLDVVLVVIVGYMWLRCRPLWSWRAKRPKYKAYKRPNQRWLKLRLRYRIWREGL